MKRQNETWFPDREKLFQKTDKDGEMLIDGEIWSIRRPNNHKLNLIEAFQYSGDIGEIVTFLKPLYNNEMSIKKGGWLAFNLENHQDI